VTQDQIPARAQTDQGLATSPGEAVLARPAAQEVAPQQIGPRLRAAASAEQAGPRVRGTATTQLSTLDPTASAPANVSSVGDGRAVAVVVVTGQDRCEPVKGTATREECADILDNRADQFAHAAAPDPTPEEQVIALPPSAAPAANATTAAQRLASGGGLNPSVVQEAVSTESTPQGAQAAASASDGDRAPPALPAGIASLLGAATTAAGAPPGSSIIITTTPAPK
jgi:hypothetical protein